MVDIILNIKGIVSLGNSQIVIRLAWIRMLAGEAIYDDATTSA